MKRFAFVLFALTALLIGCGPGKPPEVKAPEKVKNYEAKVGKVNLAFDDPKTREPVWKLSIESAKIDFSEGAKTNEGYGEMKDIKATLFEDGKPAMTVSSDTCAFDTKSQVLTLIGNVKGVSKENELTLTADKATWERKKNKITAEGAPLIVKKGDVFEMRDSKLIADTKMQTLKNYE